MRTVKTTRSFRSKLEQPDGDEKAKKSVYDKSTDGATLKLRELREDIEDINKVIES